MHKKTHENESHEPITCNALIDADIQWEVRGVTHVTDKLYHIMLYWVWGEGGKRSKWFSNTHDCFYKVADTKHKLKLRILNVTMQNQSIIIEN
jgi:hypothetical protein